MNSQHKNEGHIIPDVYNKRQEPRKTNHQRVTDTLTIYEERQSLYDAIEQQQDIKFARTNEDFLKQFMRDGIFDTLMDYSELDIEFHAGAWYGMTEEELDSAMEDMRGRFVNMVKTLKYLNQAQLQLKEKEKIQAAAEVNQRLVDALKVLQMSIRKPKK